MKGLLSVIIPVYNTEKYLRTCLQSVINQTYKNLEIIVVDDKSTDSSFSICKEFEKKDDRVFVYTNESKGVSSARNCGIKKANGEYITFVDSDDYLKLDAYEKSLNNIHDCDAIFFGFYKKYEKTNSREIVSPSYTGIANPNEAIYYCMFPNKNNYFTSACNKIYRRGKIKEVLFNESYTIGEDEVWLVESITKIEKIKLYNEPLYNYVQRTNSALHSIEKTSKNWLSHVKAKEAVMQLVPKDINYYDSIIAKAYNELFYLVVNSYIEEGYSKSQIVSNRIDKYKKYFFKSKEFDLKRKIKVLASDILIKLRTPEKILLKLWSIPFTELRLQLTKREKE